MDGLAIAQETTTPRYGFFRRIFGTIFGSKVVAEDIRNNTPYLQASLGMLAFVLVNFFAILFGLYNFITFGTLAFKLLPIIASIGIALFFALLVLAILWLAYSLIVFGASRLKTKEVGVGAAYCFSAYFYTFFTLFCIWFLLLSLVCLSELLRTSWYSITLLALLAVIVFLLVICLYKFFRASYLMGRFGAFLGVLMYIATWISAYFLVRWWYNSLMVITYV